MPKVLGEKDASAIGSIELVKKNKHYTVQTKKSRAYYVLADNDSQREDDILITTGIPPYLSILDGAACVNKKAKEIATVPRHPTTGVRAILWEVQCEFDSDVDVQEADQDPPARTPKWRWFGESEQELLEKDAIDGSPIQTVPGERIIVEGPVTRPILEIRRFEYAPWDPNVMLDYADQLNQSAFWGAPEGTALMLPMDVSEEKVVDEIRVVEVVYRIKFKLKRDENGALVSDTWLARPLHQGYKYFPFVGSPSLTWTDEQGTPELVNLAADGTILAAGADPVFLSFNRFPKTDLNTLNLGPF